MRHLTALRGGSGSRQRLGEARSGVGRLGTVAGTLSTWGLNQREGAARSSNLATASARPLVTLTTDPCRLATYGRGNRVAAPPPHKPTPGGHRSFELPDAASAVPHRRIAAAAGARAGDLTEGPCGRSPPLGRVQARHGGPEPAPVRLRTAGLTVVAAMRGLPRRCHVSSQRQPLGSCEAAIVGGQSRPSAPWPSCPGTRAVRCRSCTAGDRGSAQPTNKRVSGCHVSTKRPPPVAFQRQTGRADG